MKASCDLLVIGGGINGAAVARDAAGRGLAVVLAERDDYAAATSSASSKLIHGGLRYLEQGKFRLVRESLKERDVLLRIAPHLVFPLRFLLPITTDQPRPAWLVGIGLWLYDRLAGSQALEATGRLAPAELAALPRLRRESLRAVLHYPDCWVDDSRLVLETLLDARARGADVGNRREVLALTADGDGFAAEIAENGTRRAITARFVVNAAGPWTNQVLDRGPREVPRRGLRLVRGSHIVVPMPNPPQDYAYTLQNRDKRVVFVLPWLDRFLIVGTTDVAHHGDARLPHCSDAERDYIIAAYNRSFDPPLGAADVVWSYAGVRPLMDDGSANPSKVTRDYDIEVHRQGTGALLTVYGGKLTTHRRLGEKVVDRLARLGCKLGPAWTTTAPLHGGAFDRPRLATMAESPPPGLDPSIWRRWLFTYGSVAPEIARGSRRVIVPGITEAELVHAATIEDARTADDFLLRRTKLHLTIDAPSRATIARWFSP
ncbi:MAG: glycerol-3-phosphate dehydrogenase [Alphaproteobacteria bacterium]|nr:glycerol-3-phosphate dehydrogenase [Alphaproteobacteria bacterium]